MSLLGLYDFDLWPWADDDQPSGHSEQELNVSDIETRDESYAMQAAAETGGHNGTSEERSAFRAGWLSGREYARQQQAQAEQPAPDGIRLLGCQHPTSCTSVSQCARRPLSR